MKLGIVIDGVTLFKGLKGQRLDFYKFKDWLAQENNITYAGYFNCVHTNEGKLGFFSHVMKSGFSMFLRSPIYNHSKESYQTHGFDTELIIESVLNMDKFDKFILVSGKHNFMPLCEKMVLNNKNVEIIGFKDSVNNIFSKYNIRYIEDFLETTNKDKK